MSMELMDGEVMKDSNAVEEFKICQRVPVAMEQ